MRATGLFLVLGLPPGCAHSPDPTVLPGDPRIEPARLPPGADSMQIVWVTADGERNGPLQLEDLAAVTVDGDRVLRQVMRVVMGGEVCRPVR